MALVRIIKTHIKFIIILGENITYIECKWLFHYKLTGWLRGSVVG
jgi:hypothetical protein